MDGQTDRQKSMHMSPTCKMHRWAQKILLTPLELTEYLLPYLEVTFRYMY